MLNILVLVLCLIGISFSLVATVATSCVKARISASTRKWENLILVLVLVLMPASRLSLRVSACACVASKKQALMFKEQYIFF